MVKYRFVAVILHLWKFGKFPAWDSLRLFICCSGDVIDMHCANIIVLQLLQGIMQQIGRLPGLMRHDIGVLSYNVTQS
jgi:hypothetical protein